MPATPSPLPPDAGPWPVIAFVSSAGGVDAMKAVLAGLPADFPAALVAAQHREGGGSGRVAEILRRHTPLAVRHAEDGEPLRPATLLVAPPGRHLLVGRDDRVCLTDRLLKLCSSPDMLLESLAYSCGRRALAVVLSGWGRGGVEGALAVKAAGGVVLAQDAAGTRYPGMPMAAVAAGAVDRVVPLKDIAAELVGLAGRSGDRRRPG